MEQEIKNNIQERYPNFPEYSSSIPVESASIGISPNEAAINEINQGENARTRKILDLGNLFGILVKEDKKEKEDL